MRRGMRVPQCVLWGYGWAVWYALALNKTKWFLLLVDCLYYHTILGIVASNVVLAVVMYCLMLSFSLIKEYILKTNVHTNHIHKTYKGNSKISNLSRISPIPYIALKKPQSQPVPTATSSKSHKNRYLPQLYQGPLESTPIPPFTPLPPRPHSPTPPLVSHQKKRKRARKPA